MRRVVLSAVAFLIAAVLGIGWYLTRAPAGPLPSTDPAAVVAMELVEFARPWPSHIVDPSDYARVLRLFADGVRDPTLPTVPFVWRDSNSSGLNPAPTTWVPVWHVVISYRAGPKNTRVVTFYRAGSAPGAYSVFTGDGTTFYRGASDEEIAATFAACLPPAAHRPEGSRPNNPMQPSGEIGRFEMEDQPSPPVDR